MSSSDTRDTGPHDGLSREERERLKELEETVERGLQTFVEVGNALLEIREKELWRHYDVSNFTAYLKKRWQWSRQHGYRLINAAETVQRIEQDVTRGLQPEDGVSHGSQIDTENGVLPSPTSERQVRALRQLPEHEQALAWREAFEEAIDLAEGKPELKRLRRDGPASTVVERVVTRRLEHKEEDSTPADPSPENDGWPASPRSSGSAESTPSATSSRPPSAGHPVGPSPPSPGNSGGSSPQGPPSSATAVASGDEMGEPDRDPRLAHLKTAYDALAAAKEETPEHKTELRQRIEEVANEIFQLETKIQGTGNTWRP